MLLKERKVKFARKHIDEVVQNYLLKLSKLRATFYLEEGHRADLYSWYGETLLREGTVVDASSVCASYEQV